MTGLPMTGLGWPVVPAASAPEQPDASGLGWPTRAEPESVPVESVPVESVPEDPVPEDPVPEDPVPEDPVPEDPVPEDPVPEGPVPEDPVPEDPVPEDPVPVESDPEQEPLGTVAYRIRSLLAERTSEDPRDLTPVVDELETPIGAAAAAAVLLRKRRVEPFNLPGARRIISVSNQKGGVGKTTTTVNLAVALALHGAKVLVIDLDPQGNASTGLGVPHHIGVPDVYDVLINGSDISDVVQPAADVDGCWCVPATINLAGAEIELVSMVAREWRLQRALESYCEGAGAGLDYVFIDCPPSLGLLTVNAMAAAKELLIPIQCEYYALEGLGQLLRTTEMVQAHLNPRLLLSAILLTMHDGRTRLADQVATEVRSHFGEMVLGTIVPRSVRVSEAPGYGQSVVAYDPGSRGAIAYVEAARELADRGAAPIGQEQA